MDHGIYTAEMGNPPSPNEGPTFKALNNRKIQEEILGALKKAGMNIDVTSFEMYHQKGKLYIETREGFKIEFRHGEHYVGRGNNLSFIPTSIEYIKTALKRYNREVNLLRNLIHSQLDSNKTPTSSESYSA